MFFSESHMFSLIFTSTTAIMFFSNLFTKECGEPVIRNMALDKNGGKTLQAECYSKTYLQHFKRNTSVKRGVNRLKKSLVFVDVNYSRKGKLEVCVCLSLLLLSCQRNLYFASDILQCVFYIRMSHAKYKFLSGR